MNGSKAGLAEVLTSCQTGLTFNENVSYTFTAASVGAARTVPESPGQGGGANRPEQAKSKRAPTMPLLPGNAGSWSRLSLRPVHHAGQPTAEWWRYAVIGQIYPRPFADTNGKT
jgi:hypothetical protein